MAFINSKIDNMVRYKFGMRHSKLFIITTKVNNYTTNTHVKVKTI